MTSVCGEVSIVAPPGPVATTRKRTVRPAWAGPRVRRCVDGSSVNSSLMLQPDPSVSHVSHW